MAEKAISDSLSTTCRCSALGATRCVGEQWASLADVPHEQICLAADMQRFVAPRTPRRFRRDREARVGHRLFRTGGHIMLRSMARAESNDAEPSAGVRSNDAASTTAAKCSAAVAWPANAVIQPAITARGGYPSMARRRQVESHARRSTSGRPGRSARRNAVAGWMQRSRSFRVQQVLEGHRGRSVRLVPVGGAGMQLDDSSARPAAAHRAGTHGTGRDTGTSPVDGRAERGTCSKPRAAALRSVPRFPEQRVAQRTGEWSSTACGAGTAGLVGQPRERFAIEVVGDVAVVTCDGKHSLSWLCLAITAAR